MGIENYFFTHLISKYLKNYDYKFENEFHVLRELTHIQTVDCEKWVKLPVSMLNKYEALAMGIRLVFNGENVELENYNKSWEYFEFGRSISKKDDSLLFLYDLAQGVLSLQKAIECQDIKSQKKLLKIARFYFLNFDENIDHELRLLHLMITEVAMRNFYLGVRYLGKASKVSARPVLLLRSLEHIYESMDMNNIATFFGRRAEDEGHKFLAYG